MAAASSELKCLFPIFTLNTQPHHFPYTLKFHNENFQSKTQSLRISLLPSKILQWNTVCLAAEIVDIPPPSDDSEENPEKVVAITAAEERKDRRRAVRIAWEKLVRWSRSWRSKSRPDVLQRTQKVFHSYLHFLFQIYLFIFLLLNLGNYWFLVLGWD